MKEITKVKELITIIEQDKPILLDFYADWCGPCRTLMPVVERLAERYEKDFVIRKINVDKAPELAAEFNVRSIPALFFIKDQAVQEGMVGYHTEAALESKIKAMI